MKERVGQERNVTLHDCEAVVEERPLFSFTVWRQSEGLTEDEWTRSSF